MITFHKNRIKLAIITCLMLSMPSKPCLAQTGQYDIQAFLLMKIAKYIEWPTSSDLGNESKPFIIGVYGDNPFGSKLEEVYIQSNRKIKSRTVEVKYFKELEDITYCHMIFISESKKKQLRETIEFLKKKPILTIGDTRNYGVQGVHINFYLLNNKVRFELNESIANKAGFKIDYHLRSIAKIVGDRKGGVL